MAVRAGGMRAVLGGGGESGEMGRAGMHFTVDEWWLQSQEGVLVQGGGGWWR